MNGYDSGDGGFNKFCECVLLIVSKALGRNKHSVDLDKNISEYGIDSLAVTNIIASINRCFDLTLSPVNVYGHNTVRAFSQHIYKTSSAKLNAQSYSVNDVERTVDHLMGNDNLPDGKKTSDENNTVRKSSSDVRNSTDGSTTVNDLSEKVLSVTSSKSHIMAASKVCVERKYLIVFSDSDKDRLSRRVAELADHVRLNLSESTLLSELQSRMISVDVSSSAKEKAAFVASSSADLLDAMNAYIAGKPNQSTYCSPEYACDSAANVSLFRMNDSARRVIQKWCDEMRIEAIAGLWVAGTDLDLAGFLTEKSRPVASLSAYSPMVNKPVSTHDYSRMETA